MTNKLSDGEIKLLALQGVYIENENDIENSGIYCVKCGCKDLRVVTTMNYDGEIRRYRQCRNCGKRVRTREVVG
jgi:hypothetical protein